MLATCDGEDDDHDDDHVGLDVTLCQLEDLGAGHLHLPHPLTQTSREIFSLIVLTALLR